MDDKIFWMLIGINLVLFIYVGTNLLVWYLNKDIRAEQYQQTLELINETLELMVNLEK